MAFKRSLGAFLGSAAQSGMSTYQQLAQIQAQRDAQRLKQIQTRAQFGGKGFEKGERALQESVTGQGSTQFTPGTRQEVGAPQIGPLTLDQTQDLGAATQEPQVPAFQGLEGLKLQLAARAKAAGSGGKETSKRGENKVYIDRTFGTTNAYLNNPDAAKIEFQMNNGTDATRKAIADMVTAVKERAGKGYSGKDAIKPDNPKSPDDPNSFANFTRSLGQKYRGQDVDVNALLDVQTLMTKYVQNPDLWTAAKRWAEKNNPFGR